MSLVIDNLSRRFADFAALDDVSLRLAPGEFLALLGPSGSGKTTLLRILAGLDYPDEGTVRQEDRDFLAAGARERNVGLVFQHYALFRHLTVRENVAFGLRVRPRRTRPSKAQIRDLVERLLKRVQLEDFGDRYPTQLSGGQRQRVALARALAVEPELLLLDEPFGALDAQVRVALRRWLRELHEELGLTTVFVTHDQEEALEVADRVVLMDHGKVEQVGTPEEVYRHPASPFVYSFLGSVNLFHGRVEGEAVHVGDDRLAPGKVDLAHGSEVFAFARPHEIDIVVDGSEAGGVAAKISRILAFGVTARVELDGLNGSTGQVFEVEITRDEVARLGLEEGQAVRLVPSRLRVFERNAAASGASQAPNWVI